MNRWGLIDKHYEIVSKTKGIYHQNDARHMNEDNNEKKLSMRRVRVHVMSMNLFAYIKKNGILTAALRAL